MLGLAPFVGILGGVFFANRVTPFVFGLPFLLFWIVAWTILAAIAMALVYWLDPRNRHVASSPSKDGPS
ncbi:MAG: DUF3311 domain-containing protein [Gammaproteobacteria bacterium]|nr:DUF3311 domain-containing protein [Gammaproteobacteria bacterium]